MKAIINLTEIDDDIKQSIAYQPQHRISNINNPAALDRAALATATSLADNLNMLRDSYPTKILFTLEEAANILSISYEFIRGRAAQDKIPFTALGERRMININVLAHLLTEGVP